MTNLVINLLRPFVFRGKGRVLHALSPKQGDQKIELFGYAITLDLSDYMQRSIYLNAFEAKESSMVRSYLKPGMTFVDAGANIGYFTLMAASLVGAEGAVFAFEPSPYAFDRLSKTIKDNNITQVHAIQAGLGDSTGELQLYMPKVAGNHTPSMIDNHEGIPLNVPVLKIDEYLAQKEVDHVDLMKIDVEGFEPNVIEGARNYIQSGKIHAILCEFNNYWLEANNSSSTKFYEMLTQQGYKANEKLDPDDMCQNIFFVRS